MSSGCPADRLIDGQLEPQIVAALSTLSAFEIELHSSLSRSMRSAAIRDFIEYVYRKGGFKSRSAGAWPTTRAARNARSAVASQGSQQHFSSPGQCQLRFNYREDTMRFSRRHRRLISLRTYGDGSTEIADQETYSVSRIGEWALASGGGVTLGCAAVATVFRPARLAA